MDPLEEEVERIRRNLEKEVANLRKNLYTRRRRAGFILGTNVLSGEPVFLSEKDRQSHIHIIGTTGAGKSKLMEHMIRSDINQGKGLCLVDPHGDLYQEVLKYVVRKRLDERKVILIDPNDEQWAVGINFLEYDPSLRSPSSHASEVMKGIAKVFGDENTDILPRLQRWQRNALIPLIERKLTLVELFDFVNPNDPIFRRILLEEIDDYYLRKEWELFDKAPKSERLSYIEAVLNRANKFAGGREIRRIFGQINSTVNFREAMDQGKVVLCNLASNKLSQEEQRMLGVVIVDKIVQAAKSRVDIPERKRRPFYFYLDEFGQFVSEDIARALQELRKFKVFLVLAHQELEQLRQESPKVYSAVMSEPQVRISFRISREDAEIMAKEMFTGKIRGDREKRRIEQTKFWPKETTRAVETEMESWTEGRFTSETELGTESEGEGEVRVPVPLFLEPDRVTYTETSVRSTAKGLSFGRSSASGGGSSFSTVPWYEYEPFKEVTSIEDYSIEEIVEKYIAWIKTQPDRHAQLKIGQRPPIPIVTPFVKPLRVREKDIRTLKERVYQRYALPAEEVDRQIEERRKKFLEQAKALGLIKEEPPELTPEMMRHR